MAAQPWLIRSEMQPAFDGGFIQSKFLIGGIFVVKNKAQRNAIHILNRRLDASTTTLVVVSDENRIYRLVSNPNSLTTTDINWEVFFIGQTSSFRPVGTWDADNNILILSDADALNRNGEFYFVSDAPTQRTVQYPTLFGGIAVDVVDGDLIVSVGNKWSVITSTVQWDALSKPQSITDYVNGIVIAHTHTIANITSLQVTLDAKFDSGDVADSNIDFALVPNASIVDVEFLRQFYYTKVETSGIGVIDGDKGDIIVTGTGTTWSIDGSVTLNNKVYKLNTSAVDLLSPALGYIYYDTDKNDARLYTGSWSNITRPAYFTIASTSFTLTEAHRNAYIYFTAATLVAVTLPLGLSSGFSANLIKSGLGDVRLSTSGGYQAISDSTDIITQHTGVTVYLQPGDVWSAIGALGNVTGGGGVGVTDGDKGHIIVTSAGSVWTIDPTVTLDNKVYSLRTNSSALSSPVEGWMYYDTTADDLRVYSNTAWTNTTRPAYFTSAATSFTLTEAHRNSYIHFTAATTVTITLPITLAAGFTANLIMAGVGTLLLSTPGGYEAIGDANTVQERYTGVTVYLKPGNVWSAIGALGNTFTLTNGNGTVGTGTHVDIGGTLNNNVTINGDINSYSWYFTNMDEFSFIGSGGFNVVVDGGVSLNCNAGGFYVNTVADSVLAGVGWHIIGGGANPIILETSATGHIVLNAGGDIKFTSLSLDAAAANVLTIDVLTGIISYAAMPSGGGGGGGGITNTAAANEFTKSNGTNITTSGVFSTIAGSINLGTSLAGSSRTILADGSDSSISIILKPKTSGAVLIQDTDNNNQIEISTNNFFIRGNKLTGTAIDNFRIQGGDGIVTDIHGVGISLIGGNGYNTTGNTNGGNILLQSGVRRIAGTGLDGNITLDSLAGKIIFTQTLLNDDALTSLLVRDGTTGQIKYRSVSSISGGGSLPTVSNLTSATTVTIAGTERFLTGDATTTSFTTTIPTPVGNAGYKIVCKKIDNTVNTWTISTPAGLIDTASTVIIKYSLDSVTLESNGTNWYII